MLYKNLLFAVTATALNIPPNNPQPQQLATDQFQDISQPTVRKGQNVLTEITSQIKENQIAPSETRELTGRILHITDIHPDPFYKTYASTDAEFACHRAKGVAGIYGAESSDCDSPTSLVNATFDWLKANVRDKVDFVIWTGDSARHDNDPRIPRDKNQVVSQNEFVVSKFLDAFGKKENWDDDDPTNDFVVPIVPTFGNNDVLPHNIFVKGPNSWTNKYLNVWRQFIPEAQRHQFAEGGWFSVEVIPNKLAVFSLNTLYFFSSNSGVDSCAARKEPGYEQFDWLRIQLDLMRKRGMKAILMGHVPPARVEAKVSWDETCWQKYTLWMHQYRDVVVAGLYGHMNIDHFMVQDYQGVKKHVRKGFEYLDEKATFATGNADDEFTVTSAQDYLQSLRSVFAQIPTVEPKSMTKGDKKPKSPKHIPDESKYKDIGGQFGERYSLTFVAPSVVPNYFPTIRIYSYNISGLEDVKVPDSSSRPTGPKHSASVEATRTNADAHQLELRDLSMFERIRNILPFQKEREQRAHKLIKFTVPRPPSKSAPPGPAYSAQPLTILSYAQYFANLTYLNNDFTHDHAEDSDDDAGTEKWKHGKHHDKKPKHSKAHPFNFTFEVEYDTATDKVYKLSDLTTRSMLDLAARIAGNKAHGVDTETDEVEEARKKKKHRKHKKKHGKKNKNKAWDTFVTRAFVGIFDPDELDLE